MLLLFLWIGSLTVYAGEEQDTVQKKVEDTLYEEFDFREIDAAIRKIMPEKRLKFGETVMKIIRGDTKLSVDLIVRLLKEQLFFEFRSGKEGLVRILLLAVMAAIFTNFSGVLNE